MLNLQDLTIVYKQMFEFDFVSKFVISAKFLAAVIILISMYAKIFKNFGKWDKLLIKETDGHSLPYTIISGLVLLGLITFSTQLFTITDDIFGAIEKEYIEPHTESFDIMEMAKDPYDQGTGEDEDFSIFSIESILSDILLKVNEVISGSWVISGLMSVLMYMFDSIIYGLFLCERFFVLGMIKMMSPLIMAFSIFEKFRSMIYDLAKVLMRWYLIIIPFFFVNIFCGAIVKNMPAAMTTIAGEMGGEMLFNSSRAIFYLFLIIAKFKLYKASKTLLKELIK